MTHLSFFDPSHESVIQISSHALASLVLHHACKSQRFSGAEHFECAYGSILLGLTWHVPSHVMVDQSATTPQSVDSTPGAEHQLLILDGGTGHLLKERGVKTAVAGHCEWGNSFLVPALANEDTPDAVRQVPPPSLPLRHVQRPG